VTPRRAQQWTGVSIAALLLALAAGPAAAADRCGACHPAERVQFESSRHASEGVGCVSCHGGNGAAIDAASAHSGGFRGRPSRRDIPALCASCHSNEQRMRAYNLPVDQLALYQTSDHGRHLAAGDLRAAVCSDCHGAHDILPPEDPASRVYVSNIPRTCGRCHGDKKLMGEGPEHGGVYEEYLSSAHAKALLDRGNLRAPTCVSCHGVHGAAPPAVGDIGKVCGQCHTAERRYFAAGPHQKYLAEKGLSECASCHGHHAIEAASPARLATQCTMCHGKDSAQQQMGTAILAGYKEASSALDAAAATIARADEVPIPTEDYKARLEEGRTYLSEALPSAHSVNAGIVTPYTSRASSMGREIEHEIGAKLGEGRWHIVGLVLFWFYLLLTILVLRRFQERGPVRH
jgi:predicted CXXCH cytochrome family protein